MIDINSLQADLIAISPQSPDHSRSLKNAKKLTFEILSEIRDLGIRLNLTQGFNVRTIKMEIAKILSEIKLWKGKQWH